MKTLSRNAVMCALGLIICGFPAVRAGGYQPQGVEFATREVVIVDSAFQVLREIMAIPAQGIPGSMLADAQGIVIVPGLLKGGFVVGVRHGRGVVLVRDDAGSWRPPAFITLTGGSLGWQIGVQAADLVLVFKTRTSVESLMRGKFTIGGGIAAAAGPVGRQAEAGTDAGLRAEIYSYSRSRGLFAGVALDGSVIQVDTRANAAYYGVIGAGPPPAVPPSAQRLLDEVSRYTYTEHDRVRVTAVPGAGNVAHGQVAQQTLADASRRLAAILDLNWRQYLALPAEVYGTDRQPSLELLQKSLAKFDRVATEPQYQSLAQRTEFQQTHALLRARCAEQAASARLTLPPPPSDDFQAIRRQ